MGVFRRPPTPSNCKKHSVFCARFQERGCSFCGFPKGSVIQKKWLGIQPTAGVGGTSLFACGPLCSTLDPTHPTQRVLTVGPRLPRDPLGPGVPGGPGSPGAPISPSCPW